MVKMYISFNRKRAWKIVLQQCALFRMNKTANLGLQTKSTNFKPFQNNMPYRLTNLNLYIKWVNGAFN